MEVVEEEALEEEAVGEEEVLEEALEEGEAGAIDVDTAEKAVAAMTHLHAPHCLERSTSRATLECPSSPVSSSTKFRPNLYPPTALWIALRHAAGLLDGDCQLRARPLQRLTARRGFGEALVTALRRIVSSCELQEEEAESGPEAGACAELLPRTRTLLRSLADGQPIVRVVESPTVFHWEVG